MGTGIEGGRGPGLERGPACSSVMQLLVAQQRPNRVHFRPHVAPRLFELGDGATVAAPAEPDQHRDQGTGDAAHDQRRSPEAEARIQEQQRVEREKADGEYRECPAQRPHRTGWRRAGRTMRVELAATPNAASVVDSSNTRAPWNFTT